MNYRIIGFRPPHIGLEGSFNTFRLGGFYAKNLTVGEKVLLIDEKDRITIGVCVVESVEMGPLADMLERHAHENHTQKGRLDGKHVEELGKVMRKIYGPQCATDNRLTSVIGLRRLP